MSEWFEAKYGVEGLELGDGLVNIAVFFEATEESGHKVSINHDTLKKKFKDRNEAKKEAVLWAIRLTEQALTELKEIKDDEQKWENGRYLPSKRMLREQKEGR